MEYKGKKFTAPPIPSMIPCLRKKKKAQTKKPEETPKAAEVLSPKSAEEENSTKDSQEQNSQPKADDKPKTE